MSAPQPAPDALQEVQRLLAELRDALARVEATQAEHGQQLTELVKRARRANAAPAIATGERPSGPAF